MQAYIYQAALLCEACALARRATCEPNEDSGFYPQGPYSEGGGEADCPQHCDACGLFLENQLTPDGVAYVQEKLDAGTEGEGNAAVLATWAEYYGLEPRYWHSSSCGKIELRLTLDDAHCGSHQGQCDDDIEALRRVPYIAEQLARIDSAALVNELGDYGAWNETELSDHDANLSRFLWIACGAIVDEARQ